MKRFTSIFLLLTFVALGSGLLARLHAAQHAWSDAIHHHHHTEDHSHQSPHDPADEPQHNESNCLVHALLSVPLTLAEPAATWSAEIEPSGTVESPQTLCIGLRAPVRTDCRGPPVVS